MHDQQLTTRMIEDESDWHSLRSQWNPLLERSSNPNPFLTWEWQTVWWQCFKARKNLAIVCAECGDRLVGVLPLYRAQRYGMDILNFIGYGELPCPEYLGPILDSDFVAAASDVLIRSLDSLGLNWKCLFLEEYLVEDTATSTFIDRLGERYPLLRQPGSPRYYIALPATYDEYLSTLSAHNRHNKRNRLRKAIREQGARLMTMRAEDIDTWLPVCRELSRMSRLRCGTNSPFDRKDYYQFHRMVLERMLPVGTAHVFQLQLEGEVAAFMYVYEYMGKYFGYQTGIDPAHKGSPGDIALQLLLIHAIEAGVKEFDFLRGEHAYKNTYTDTCRDTQSVFAFPDRSLVHGALMGYHGVLRPAKARIRALLRRVAKRG